jgi:predicted Zn finger-like uncharacterized protein
MKVSCQACGAKYTIADDKVRGRKVKIRCKSCGTPMVVDGQSEAPEAAAGAGAAAPAGGGDVSWSVNLSDTDQRTMTTDEIVAAWKTGEVTTDAFVWKDGMGDWVPVLECAELKPLLAAAAPGTGPGAPTPFGPTIVTATAAATSARLAGGGRGAAVDLFDAASASPPEEDDIATSAPALPTAGSTAYDDGKLTGARNENSVLFSLDALRGGGAASGGASKSEPKKAPAPARRSGAAPATSDPFAMSPADAGAANPLFSLNANQALLTAPAPPEPPPPRVSASGAAGAPPMNKLVVYGGGAAAAVILLLVGLLLGRSESKETAAPDSSAKEHAAATTSAESEKKTEEKDAKDEKAKPSETANTEPSAKPTATTTSTSTAPSTTNKAVSTSSTKSSSSSSKEKEKESKPTAKPEEMPSQGNAPFSVSAAQVALTQAASNASSCAKAAGPTGGGKVQVTFATSGRVTTATVMGSPFAGTQVGGCVAGVFRKARVPAFSGNPVTVSKSFAIH